MMKAGTIGFDCIGYRGLKRHLSSFNGGAMLQKKYLEFMHFSELSKA